MVRIVLVPLAALLLLSMMAIEPAMADDVDVALVLVTDVSRSIDDSEFKLEKDGYTSAFTSQKVLEAIHGGPTGRIAVAYLEFASSFEVRTVLDWTVIHDAASGQAFADRLVATPRSASGRTAIGEGIAVAMHDLATSGLKASRQVIDVCGDGTSNAGRDVGEARDAAVAAGIIVNGLTIINEHPVAWAFAHVQPPGGLTAWYRDHVIGGPGSFVLEVHDFQSFSKAMTRKLVDEIASR